MPGHPAQSLVSSAPTELIGQGRLPVNIAINFGNPDAKVSIQTSVITLNANVLLILCVLISIAWCGLVGCSPYSAVQRFNTIKYSHNVHLRKGGRVYCTAALGRSSLQCKLLKSCQCICITVVSSVQHLSFLEPPYHLAHMGTRRTTWHHASKQARCSSSYNTGIQPMTSAQFREKRGQE